MDTNSKPQGNSIPALYAQSDILIRGRFSKSHLYNLIARGQFPRPCIRSGPRFTRWGSTDVDAWFADPAAWISSHAAKGLAT